jgi:hypothetical protein
MPTPLLRWSTSPPSPSSSSPGFFFNFNNAVFEDIAKVFPIYWFKESMLTAFGTEPSSSGWNGQDLLVMLVWGVVGLAVTLRFFRWESRRV